MGTVRVSRNPAAANSAANSPSVRSRPPVETSILNERAYWRNVPSRVWHYTLGGYQVMKKWRSYRELAILGRPLTTKEVREVRDMARRIAALLLLEPALDANYAAVKAGLYPWTSAKQSAPVGLPLW